MAAARRGLKRGTKERQENRRDATLFLRSFHGKHVVAAVTLHNFQLAGWEQAPRHTKYVAVEQNGIFLSWIKLRQPVSLSLDSSHDLSQGEEHGETKAGGKR